MGGGGVAQSDRESWSSTTISAGLPCGSIAPPSSWPAATRTVISANRATISSSAPPRIRHDQAAVVAASTDDAVPSGKQNSSTSRHGCLPAPAQT